MSTAEEPRHIGPGVRLLDVDPDLGADLPDDEREQARQQVMLAAVELKPGPWEITSLATAPGVKGEPLGFLMCSGSVALTVALADRTCSRLITPNEMVLLNNAESESIAMRWSWSVIDPTTVAVLDDRLLLIARRWPTLMKAILKCAASGVQHAQVKQAISQLPRIQDRLLALFWSIADRQGIVREDGIWIHLPISHDMLAQMVGARRPTVSLGLTALAEQGTIRAIHDGWVIHPDSRTLIQPRDGNETCAGDDGRR